MDEDRVELHNGDKVGVVSSPSDTDEDLNSSKYEETLSDDSHLSDDVLLDSRSRLPSKTVL